MYRPPLLCRLNWHDWHALVVTGWERPVGRQCTRCNAVELDKKDA